MNLENQTREGDAVIGVWRQTKPHDATLDDALTDAFAKEGLSGERNRWWAWDRFLPSEYGDWNNAPAPAAMHHRRQETADLLASEILRVHRIAGPVISAFVRGTLRPTDV